MQAWETSWRERRGEIEVREEVTTIDDINIVITCRQDPSMTQATQHDFKRSALLTILTSRYHIANVWQLHNLISTLIVISMRVGVLVIGQSISRLCCTEEAIKCVVTVLVSVGVLCPGSTILFIDHTATHSPYATQTSETHKYESSQAATENFPAIIKEKSLLTNQLQRS